MLFCILVLPAHGQTPVDLELVIAADVSVSMDREERRLQQRGFVQAFQHPEIQRAIQSGATGRIAVAYLEWGGEGQHRLVVPWTLLDSVESAERFAMRLEASRPARFKKGTSLSSALLRSHDLLRQSGYAGARRIINISGDGINNRGPELESLRAEVLADGITINRLPIIYKGRFDDVADPSLKADPELLIHYFERNVIGGPHAFVEPVADIGNYAQAIHRKLIREIGSPTYASNLTPRSCLRTRARPIRRCAPS